MRLWLVRHAQPDVPEGLCYGSSDVRALTDHTQQAAAALASELPHVASVTTSGLRRTQQLAQVLAALRPDLPDWRADERINEMDFGCWEMTPWDRIPREAYDDWARDFYRHRFGGREGVADVLARVRAALTDAVQSVRSSEDAVWITHAGVISAVRYLLTNPDAPPQAHEWPAHGVPFGGWLTVNCPGYPPV